MNNRQLKKGFTLLELIVVIIIVGVLAGLSVTRFLKLIEYSRLTEAVNVLKIARQAMERCYIMGGGNFTNCNSFDKIALDDQAAAANNHFTYGFSVASAQKYTITATRNTKDGGSTNPSDFVGLYVDYGVTSGQTIYLQGSGIYNGYHQ